VSTCFPFFISFHVLVVVLVVVIVVVVVAVVVVVFLVGVYFGVDPLFDRIKEKMTNTCGHVQNNQKWIVCLLTTRE